jgi:hypothetical protein
MNPVVVERATRHVPGTVCPPSARPKLVIIVAGRR